ncbi:MAG TPA: TerB family tellurite resistance protein [Bacteroidales bacterium]|nr:TerB family tellurite resistance protein [Bacteroidales bacterium]
MAKLGKWIGGGLGWALGGPIGGILGFLFGSMVDGMQSGEYEIRQGPTRPGDFSISLLILTAAVMRADGTVKRVELDLVKQFLQRQFGADKAAELILVLREILQKEIDIQPVCRQIRQQMEYPSRLQLLHFLFAITRADEQVHPAEWTMVKEIGMWLGMPPSELEALEAMFRKDDDAAYQILEISPDASDEEVKKAYRRQAMRHHPDKVSHLGPEIHKAAEEKFRALNEAYERIKRKRNIT